MGVPVDLGQEAIPEVIVVTLAVVLESAVLPLDEGGDRQAI